MQSGLNLITMNELSNESSPYLLQHAQNPVHWKAWSRDSLNKAESLNQLIIISSGYSACHWCHVMEHESFEDQDVAHVMNTHFVNIKVDREERPDVDAVYMKAVQIMTGRGGWPLNVVCLPDGRPVWGASYVPKKEWISYLSQLAEMFKSTPEKLFEYAERLHNGLNSISIIEAPSQQSSFQIDLEALVDTWSRSFDTEFGGYGRAPKFMMPTDHVFLMNYGVLNQDQKVIDHVNLSLTRMAWGGLFDTVGGGFSRYSVDMKWHVPHFEKMLYDNGQLVSLYSDAYKLTKNTIYKNVIEKTLSFIDRELSNADGGFYSALDADSIDNNEKLTEGAYYRWNQPELKAILKDDYALFAEVFNVNDFGYWEDGYFVLIQSEPLDELARRNGITPLELSEKKQAWEKMLFDHRSNRQRPRLDDKCLTSWNAIMLKGFVDAYQALDDQQYLNRALANAAFIKQNLSKNDGGLLHNHKDGKSNINGYLEDYAAVIEAFLSLYSVTFDPSWLTEAKNLADYCFKYFYDEKAGFFSFTSKLDESLISPHFEIEDNVIPASNSAMASNLLTLSTLYNETGYENVVSRMLGHIIPNIDYPSAYSNWLSVFLRLQNSTEIAICGSDAIKAISKLKEFYLPNLTVAGSTTQRNLPFLSDRFSNDSTLYYICKNKSCDLPKNNFDDALTELLKVINR